MILKNKANNNIVKRPSFRLRIPSLSNIDLK